MLRGAGISTHVPRTGHDNMEDATWFHTHIFQSTRPLRGATSANGKKLAELMVFQSTRPVRGTTTWRMPHGSTRTYFNPRAPYGARPVQRADVGHVDGISIHAPLTGHDRTGDDDLQRHGISIHVPRTGHDGNGVGDGVEQGISIHVPRTGHDLPGHVVHVVLPGFQSTCPVRGTTHRPRE